MILATCCYYGTIHQTTKILAAICHRKGQRAFVGKCNMDRESAPNYTESSSAKSIEDTKEFVKFVRTHCVSPTVIAGLDGQLPLTTSTPPISPIGTGNISIASLSISPLSTSDADEEDHPIQPRSRTSSLSNGNAGKLAKNMFSKTSLVQPILTPRFAISCTDELLADLGKMLSKDPTLALQTHLAENLAEITFTKSSSHPLLQRALLT
jgi:guanine deaminase